MSRKSSSLVTGALCAGALGLTGIFGAGAAIADPSPLPTPGVPSTYSAYAATGSDTIQDLYNAFGTTNDVDSWNAFGSSSIQTKSSGPAFQRPAGSGDGRKALSASWDSANHIWKGVDLYTSHAVDIARSSGQPSVQVAAGASNDNLTSIPLARDAVDVAVGSSLKGVIANVTTAQLRALYKCTAGAGVTFTGNTAHLAGRDLIVQLPQAGSGTRSFFLTALGITAPGACVVDGGTADPTQENNAGDVLANGIIPFSAGSYIAQFNNVAPNTGVVDMGLLTVDGRPGVSVSGSVASPSTASNSLYGDPTLPVPAQNVGSPANPSVLSRDVYSVVATSNLASDATLRTLVTTTLPGASATISQYGFLPLAFSGTPASHYIHSPFEH